MGKAVRAYYAALEAAVHDPSRNVDALADVIDGTCPCREIVDVLRDEARRGRHADYRLTISHLDVPNATAIAGTAFVTVAQSSGHLYDSTGRVVEVIAGLTQSYFVDVRSRHGRWLVVRVTSR